MAHLARFRQFCCAVLASAPLLATTAVAAAPAAAQTAQQLSPGQATTLSAPGVDLRPVADGRLASYGAESTIEGITFASQAGVGTTAVSAAPGAQLVVLHVVTAWDLSDVDMQAGDPRNASLSVVSGNLTAPLQVTGDNYPSPDDEYYAAAVPAGAPALLVLSVGGLLPQTFDLRSGQRVGSPPAALYRAPVPALTYQSQSLTTFTATTQAGSATGQFGVTTAYLSYWQPFSTTFAPSPGEAYLDVEFAPSKLVIPGYNAGDAGPTDALPAGSVTFKLPDGQTFAATADVDPAHLYDIFGGDYYALIPADTTQVQVTVTLNSVPVQVPSVGGSGETNLTVTDAQPLTALVGLPPYTPDTAPADTVPPAGARTATARPVRHSGSGSGAALGLALLVVVALALSAAAYLRHRRRPVGLPATPVRWPPAGLPPGAVRLLGPRPAGALPPPVGAGRRLDPPTGVFGPPADAPDGPGPQLAIRVLGPLEVEGLLQPIRRRSVQRLLVILALTADRPLSADELGMAISDHPERDPKPASLHSYASMLRRSLPAGTLPEAGAAGYQLDHRAVSVDWAALARVAQGSPADPGWVAQAADALALVRGRPLAGATWEGVEPAVRLMQATIERLARSLAAHQLDAGDPASAESAAARALAAVPASVGLWEDRLSAAAAGSGYGLERAWADAQAALGPDAALLAHHYRTLQARLGQEPSPA